MIAQLKIQAALLMVVLSPAIYAGIALAEDASIEGPSLTPPKNPIKQKQVTLSQMVELFTYLKNTPLEPGPKQRLPWHFIDDGCYARAHVMAKTLEEMGIYSKKIFIQGSLRVSSIFAADGKCERWLYHVAPVVFMDVGGKETPFVIDPSISSEFLQVASWKARLVGQSQCRWIDQTERPLLNEDNDAEQPCVMYYTERFNYDPHDTDEARTEWVQSDFDGETGAYADLLYFREAEKLRESQAEELHETPECFD